MQMAIDVLQTGFKFIRVLFVLDEVKLESASVLDGGVVGNVAEFRLVLLSERDLEVGQRLYGPLLILHMQRRRQYKRWCREFLQIILLNISIGWHVSYHVQTIAQQSDHELAISL